MISIQNPSLEHHVADALIGRTDDVCREWRAQLASRFGPHAEQIFSAEDFTGQAAELVRAVAEYVELPVAGLKPEVMDRLRLHVQIRQEHGSRADDILEEFRILANLLSDRLTEAVASYPGAADPVRAAECAVHLRDGLMTVAATAVGMHRQETEDQERELFRHLEEFARSIIHELRSPLHTIRLGTELLHQDDAPPTEARRRGIEWIERGIARALDLVEDIRVLALVHGLNAERRWVPLRSVVEDVLLQVHEAAGKRSVHCEIQEPLPDIRVDAVQVGIALINLVTNAIRYSDPEKATRWVKVGAERAGEAPEAWKIFVEDNGLGIPEALQHKIFRRHFRAHPDAAEGTGLGLSITQQVVEQKNGRIWFDSTEGVGTTFYVLVPERKEFTAQVESDERSIAAESFVRQ